MSGLAWAFAALLLTGAAAVAAWPAGAALRRLDGGRRKPLRAIAAVDLRRLRSRIQELVDGPPRRALGAAALTGAAAGWIAAGPVAGLVFAAYSALGARAAVRRAGRRRAATARSRSLDDLNTLAADLRAGLAIGPLGAAPTAASSATGRYVATAIGAVPPFSRGAAVLSPSSGAAARPFPPGIAIRTGDGPPSSPDAAAGAIRSHEFSDPRLGELTAAVWRLAEQTGAPAADLVERIEADARAGDRSRATAAAHAAGAQATALLLAALPIGGIALGYGIGVDPLRVLFHTPLGAACAIGAVLLQCGGLLWADRLSDGPT